MITLPYYDVTITAFSRMLFNMDLWIDKASQHATHRKFDSHALFNYRLAPDQYGLGRQVQAACDTAKYCAAKMAGRVAPAHPDTETTLSELRARIQVCRDYLATFTPSDFDVAPTVTGSHAWMGGKGLTHVPYALQYAVPNFYFHATTAYAILRHAGVDLGKADFLGELPLT